MGADVVIEGAGPRGVLYGAYRYAERLGVRFHLDGDVIPDERLKELQTALQEARTEPQKEEIRKRLKRLRYCAEAVTTLYPGKRQRRYLDALRRAQEALGRWCDLKLAEATFHELARHDPRAWFAVGWLTAERDRQLDPAGRALQRLAATDPFASPEPRP